MCLIVVYCSKNHYIAEGSAYAAHENHHIGEMQCRCSELGAARNLKDYAGVGGGNHSTVQTDAQGCHLSPCRVDERHTSDNHGNHSMHCTPSYFSLFARTQGGKKAELQGQGSGMTGATGKGGEKEKIKDKRCKILSGKLSKNTNKFRRPKRVGQVGAQQLRTNKEKVAPLLGRSK